MQTDKNDKFPFVKDQKRIKKLNEYYRIFRGKLYSENQNETVFQLKQYFQNSPAKKETLAIAVNLGALISTISADFLFGDDFRIRHTNAETEKKLRDYQLRDNLNQKLYESSLLHSAIGYTAFQVRKEGEVATAEEVPYNNYFPDFNGVILGSEPKKKILGSYFRDGEDSNKLYILKQIHYIEDGSGHIDNEVWLVDNSTLKQMKKMKLKDYYPDMDETVDTGLEYIPVFQVNNIKTIKENFGESDYVKILDLLDEVNNRVTQLSLQFIKHLTAKMAVPRGGGSLDEDGNQKAEDTEIFFMDPGEEAPKYIEYSNQLIEEAFKQIDQVIDKISAISQVPRMLLGGGEKGGVEKVEALKIRMIPLLKKTTRNRNSYSNLITKILRAVADYENFELDLSGLTFEFNEGLPVDPLIESRAIDTAIKGGFMSKRTGTKVYQDIEGEELQGEIDQIKEEEKDAGFDLNV